MFREERFGIFIYRAFLFMIRRGYSFFLSLSLGCHLNCRFDFGVRIIGSRNISIGERFYAGKNLWIESVFFEQRFGRINISADVAVSDSVHIASARYVEIGAGTLIGSSVIITDHDHGSYSDGRDDFLIAPNNRPLNVKGDVIIGRNVWISDGVKILSGVVIGNNSVVAANSVVVSSIPDNCLVAGIPAKIIKYFNVN